MDKIIKTSGSFITKEDRIEFMVGWKIIIMWLFTHRKMRYNIIYGQVMKSKWISFVIHLYLAAYLSDSYKEGLIVWSPMGIMVKGKLILRADIPNSSTTIITSLFIWSYQELQKMNSVGYG